MTMLTFPPNFRWGAATAAAQIEGGGHEGGKGDSIWDVLCRRDGAIDDASDIEVACDHYNRMEADVALMKELGLRTYRFSVSWARVMPDGRTVNEEGLAFYERLVDELTAAGIEPWLTLYHWDLPQALQETGGWADRATADAFADYARAVYRRLGGKVKIWTTLNEPWCASLLSYAGAEHAPAVWEPARAIAAVHHLLLGHGLAVRALREEAAADGSAPSVGLTLNFATVHASDKESEGDLEAARRIDGLANRLFLDPIFRREYPADVVEDMSVWADMNDYIEDGDLEIIATDIDVLGVNFYNGQTVAAPLDGASFGGPGVEIPSPNVGSENVRGIEQDLPKTAMGWQIDANDLYLLLTRLHSEYTSTAGADGAGIPLVITENGAAFDDKPDNTGFVDDTDTRLAYIRDHVAAVHRAIGDGVRVEGYLVWSLMDNFEWARGYTKRFGVVRVNYETQERIPKASARWFTDVIDANGFSLPDA